MKTDNKILIISIFIISISLLLIFIGSQTTIPKTKTGILTKYQEQSSHWEFITYYPPTITLTFNDTSTMKFTVIAEASSTIKHGVDYLYFNNKPGSYYKNKEIFIYYTENAMGAKMIYSLKEVV